MTNAKLRDRFWAHAVVRNLTAMLLLGAAGSLLISGEAWSQTTFDHFSTGFILDGAHTNVSCESCHVGGTFGPTDSRCSGCHSQTGMVRASFKPANHVQTVGDCDDCHITANWKVVSFVDHSSLTGSCISCHNGVQATGKHPTHVSSSDQCDDCHSTVAWLPAVYDHAGVVGNFNWEG